MPALNPARARRRMASRGLGGKPLDLPARALEGIEQAVVQPVRAPLPELQALREHSIAAPVRRARRLVPVALAGFFHGALENLSRGDRGALLGGPCGKPR